MSRAQLFDDTNKRTAVLAANVPLLKEGSGVFYIPESAMENTLNLMSDFYHSNDNRLLVAVLDDIAVSDQLLKNSGHTEKTQLPKIPGRTPYKKVK